MIDLKELERSVDEALFNETKESLNEWLLDLRKEELSRIMGQGSFRSFKSIPFKFPLVKIRQDSYVRSDEYFSPKDFCRKIAA